MIVLPGAGVDRCGAETYVEPGPGGAGLRRTTATCRLGVE